MTITPMQQLVAGALLGDIVELMTGRDLNIERSPSHYEEIVGCHLTRCSHTTRANVGHILLGTAQVILEGTVTSYTALLKSRMKEYLNSQHAQPVIKSYDHDQGILMREFFLDSSFGVLHIHEKLFMHNIESFIQTTRAHEKLIYAFNHEAQFGQCV